ncbi:heme-binding protein [Novosphingobium flavum]|uniref:Heme-binding protein n=2 Tax=Novosphingobium flavum TaxID=1778672 RepID=A0A7X1FRV8_9SPHN|nr:heme-binding protein [Novosphingobium flavum]
MAFAVPAYAADPAPGRAPGMPLALAVEAARTSIAACLAQGARVTVEVKDSAGVTVALLSEDGADAASIATVRSRNQAVLKTRTPSGGGDPALSAEPRLAQAGRGALPVLAGTAFLGAYGVAGSASDAADEACARTGLAHVAARIR